MRRNRPGAETAPVSFLSAWTYEHEAMQCRVAGTRVSRVIWAPTARIPLAWRRGKGSHSLQTWINIQRAVMEKRSWISFRQCRGSDWNQCGLLHESKLQFKKEVGIQITQQPIFGFWEDAIDTSSFTFPRANYKWKSQILYRKWTVKDWKVQKTDRTAQLNFLVGFFYFFFLSNISVLELTGQQLRKTKSLIFLVKGPETKQPCKMENF